MSDKSKLFTPGPITILRPELPKVLAGASAKADVLNQRSTIRSDDGKLPLSGPTRFARWTHPRQPVLVRLPGAAMVNGLPLPKAMMLMNCQPLMSCLGNPLCPFPNGRRYIELKTNLCL